ncbi:MAG: hypothetical protein JSS32_09555 [Verrucomicrobia bacterium]|nr:hypothetical protein [Verrucomicrobiota bacterium]
MNTISPVSSSTAQAAAPTSSGDAAIIGNDLKDLSQALAQLKDPKNYGNIASIVERLMNDYFQAENDGSIPPNALDELFSSFSNLVLDAGSNPSVGFMEACNEATDSRHNPADLIAFLTELQNEPKMKELIQSTIDQTSQAFLNYQPSGKPVTGFPSDWIVLGDDSNAFYTLLNSLSSMPKPPPQIYYTTLATLMNKINSDYAQIVNDGSMPQGTLDGLFADFNSSIFDATSSTGINFLGACQEAVDSKNPKDLIAFLTELQTKPDSIQYMLAKASETAQNFLTYTPSTK